MKNMDICDHRRSHNRYKNMHLLKILTERLERQWRNVQSAKWSMYKMTEKWNIIKIYWSERNLPKVFLDICGPFPRSRARRKYKFIVIIRDQNSKYTKLYPINKSSTCNIWDTINKCTEEVGTPECIVIPHGT